MNEKSRILLSVAGTDPRRWHGPLSARREVIIAPDGADDASIRYAVVWKQPPNVLSRLPGLKAIFCTGAGVDHLLADPGLPDVPIVRMIAPNLTQYMVEYVTWRVLDHHRQGSLYRSQQPRRIWHEPPQPSASEVAVGIMGLGELGTAAARVLLALGYRVNGWTRTPRQVEGVACRHGAEGLAPFLAETDILVVLLPDTPATRGIVDHLTLAGLRRDGALGGPVLINAGRGRLQKEADILRALDDGTLKEASLDVFETEPLPAESALWTHPRVFVTPHAAAASEPAHLAPAMLDQMDALDRGEALDPRYLVDRAAGY